MLSFLHASPPLRYIPTNQDQAFVMKEHLQRALIEVLYATAEFNERHATAPRGEEYVEDSARLFLIRANLEKLLPLTREQAAQLERAA
jgi:hypothetical protein